MSRKKSRAKDLKKQRWAGIVSLILALAMIVSLLGAYLSQRVASPDEPTIGDVAELQPENYMDYYREEIRIIESYLEENDPDEDILLQLSENYRYLIIFQQAFSDNEQEMQQLQEKLIAVQKSLIELDPDNVDYRLRLIDHYLRNNEEEKVILAEIDQLIDLLRENPDPLTHLILVGMLSSLGDLQTYDEELNWLHIYLGDKVEQGVASNEEYFYYAVLIGEYRADYVTAEQILQIVINDEEEDSPIHEQAISYLEYIQTEGSKVVLD